MFVRNVNHALPAALLLLAEKGLPVAPRGKRTLELPTVMLTTYAKPREMVLADPLRDANPYFHFFEALWVLAGREDVGFLKFFLPRITEFSDDGIRFHAPYGHRLRHAFGFDQIEAAIAKLQVDPDSRQVVMSIWSPQLDMQATSRDLPCNDLVMLKIRNGALRMTVCNRSNDVIWGAYGANVVQFSTLLIYMAARIGVEVGSYTQISDSFHVYEDNPFWCAWNEAERPRTVYDPYAGEWQGASMRPVWMDPIDLQGGTFDNDLHRLFGAWDDKMLHEVRFATPSFQDVVQPMLRAFIAWRAGDPRQAMLHNAEVAAFDWRDAAYAWMQRRLDARSAKAGSAA
jgi:hypothetical protein